MSDDTERKRKKGEYYDVAIEQVHAMKENTATALNELCRIAELMEANGLKTIQTQNWPSGQDGLSNFNKLVGSMFTGLLMNIGRLQVSSSASKASALAAVIPGVRVPSASELSESEQSAREFEEAEKELKRLSAKHSASSTPSKKVKPKKKSG